MSLYDNIINPDFEDLPDLINLSGVTFNGRQSFIRQLNKNMIIVLKRDYNNDFDKNAIGVFLRDGRQLGWIQRKHAIILAPEIDCGVKWKAKIDSVVGDNQILGIVIRPYVG